MLTVWRQCENANEMGQRWEKLRGGDTSAGLRLCCHLIFCMLSRRPRGERMDWESDFAASAELCISLRTEAGCKQNRFKNRNIQTQCERFRWKEIFPGGIMIFFPPSPSRDAQRSNQITELQPSGSWWSLPSRDIEWPPGCCYNKICKTIYWMSGCSRTPTPSLFSSVQINRGHILKDNCNLLFFGQITISRKKTKTNNNSIVIFAISCAEGCEITADELSH